MDNQWINLIEISILGATLLTTVALSLFIALQARRHFRLQHAKEFIARFNSAEMVKVRNTVDRWLASARPAAELLSAERGEGPCGPEDAAIAMRTFINFYQELGVAWKHGTVHHEYTWDLFGGLASRYWKALAPYCAAQREAQERPTLYRDFEHLVHAMAAMDRKRTKPDVNATTVYLFGYGSLISQSSAERTLGRSLPQGALQKVWLNGYARGWTVYDTVEFEGSTAPQPTAFLNVAPDVSQRCNGIALPVARDELERFDQRERSYRRVDVSAHISPPLDKPVYTYVGVEPWTTLPKETVVAERYATLVEAAVQASGEAFANDYKNSTQDNPWPLVAGTYSFPPRS